MQFTCNLTKCTTSLLISFYADNVILYMTNLDYSIPSLVQLFNLFGNFSGYKTNKCKSCILLPSKDDNQIQVTTKFYVVDSFPYLGIQIMADIDNIYTYNTYNIADVALSI